MTAKAEWIRELDVPEETVATLANAGIHSCRDWTLAAKDKTLPEMGTEQTWRLIHAIWRQNLGMPLSTWLEMDTNRFPGD